MKLVAVGEFVDGGIFEVVLNSECRVVVLRCPVSLADRDVYLSSLRMTHVIEV